MAKRKHHTPEQIIHLLRQDVCSAARRKRDDAEGRVGGQDVDGLPADRARRAEERDPTRSARVSPRLSQGSRRQ